MVKKIGRMSGLTFAFTLLFLSTVGGRVLRRRESERGGEGGHKCVDRCPPMDSPEYVFPPGHSYAYSLETTSRVGVERGDAWMKVRGILTITPTHSCNHLLTLSGITLEDSDPTRETIREFTEDLHRHPLPFALSNGRILSLCPATQEKDWVLNIKRGILSSLQNTMMETADKNLPKSTAIERDVMGECVTEYERLGGVEGGEVSFKKTKNLLSCKDRTSITTSIHSLPFSGTDNSMHSLPLLKSTYKCVQTFRTPTSYPSVVQCEEKDTLQPFASESFLGVNVVSTVSLTLQRARPATKKPNTGNSFSKTDLLYKPVEKIASEAEAREEALKTLRELCAAPSPTLHIHSPALFSRLRESLRTIRNLKQFYHNVLQRLPQCTLAKSMLVDAAQSLSTGGGVELMKELIRGGEVDERRAAKWYSTLPFTHNPDRQVLAQLPEIIESKHQAAVLGASTLVHKYCQQHHNCHSHPEVRSIVHKLETPLDRTCHVRQTQTDTVVLHLKALGNAGQLNKQLVLKCAERRKNPLSVRLAAVDAFRRVSCDTDRRQLFDLMEKDANSQIRVSAYLNIISCPSPLHIRRVVQFLKDENPDSVVGQFIFSHLSGVGGGECPQQKELRHRINKEVLPHHFLKPKRLHPSKYMQLSRFWDTLNSGVQGEGYALFGKKHLVPKQGMVNLTISLFGRSVNLLEVGGHAEGLEDLGESIFGKHGKSLRNLDLAALDFIRRASGRSKRSIKASPTGIGYVKVFGNELGYIKLEDLEKYGTREIERRGNEESESLWQSLARERSVEWSKNVPFLDSSLTLPTLIGLPLTLKLNATASLLLQMNGHMDVRNIQSGELDIKGAVKPSAAVELSGSMWVDGFHSRSGVRFGGKVFQSSHVEGSVEVKKGEELKLKWKTPEDQMHFLDVKSELYVVHRNSESKHNPHPSQVMKTERCSGVGKYLGFELCGEVSYPKPNYFMGPVSAIFYWRKTDAQLSEYTLAAKFNPRNAIKYARFIVDSPGSKVNRKFDFHVHVNTGAKEGFIEIDTPIKKLSVTGKYEWNLRKKMALFEVTSDKDTYTLISKMEFDGSHIYTPHFKVTNAGKDVVVLDGKISTLHSAWSTDLSLKGLTSKPITFNGRLQHKIGLYILSLNQEHPKFTTSAKVSSHLTRQTSGMRHTSELQFEYNPSRGKKQHLTWNTKVEKSNGGVTASAENKNTWFPSLNGFGKFEALEACKTDMGCGWETSLSLAKVRNQDPIEITSFYMWKEQRDIQRVNLDIGSVFKVPSRRLVYSAKVSSEQKGTQLWKNKLEVESKNGDQDKNPKQLTVWVDLENHADKLNLAGKMGYEYADVYRQLKSEIREPKAREYQANLIWSDFPSQSSYPFNLLLDYKTSGNAISHARHVITGKVTTKNNDPITFKSFLEIKPQYLDVATKGQYADKGFTAEMHYDYVNSRHNIKGQVKNNIVYKFLLSTKGQVTGNKFTLDTHINKHAILSKGEFAFNAVEQSVSFDGEYKGPLDHSKIGAVLERKTDNAKVEYQGMAKMVETNRELWSVEFNTTKFSHKHDYVTNARVKWHPEQVVDLNVHMERTPRFYATFSLTTPFEKLRKVSAAWNKVHRGTRKVDFLVRTSGGEFYTKAMGKTKVEGDKTTKTAEWIAQSTVPGYKRAGITLSHSSVSGREYKAEAKATWNNQQILANGHGSLTTSFPATIVNAGLHMETPFRNARKMALLVSHRHSKEGINTEMALQTNPTETHKLRIQGKNMINNKNGRIIEGEATVEPHGKKPYSLSYKHKNDDKTWECTARWEKGTGSQMEFYNAAIDGSLYNVGQRFSMDAQMVVTSSQPNILVFSVKASHSHMHHPFTHNTEITVSSRRDLLFLIRSKGKCKNQHPNRYSPKVHHMFVIEGPTNNRLHTEFKLDWSEDRQKMAPISWITTFTGPDENEYKILIAHEHKLRPYAHKSEMKLTKTDANQEPQDIFVLKSAGNCEDRNRGSSYSGSSPKVGHSLGLKTKNHEILTKFDLDWTYPQGKLVVTWDASITDDGLRHSGRNSRYDLKFNHYHELNLQLKHLTELKLSGDHSGQIHGIKLEGTTNLSAANLKTNWLTTVNTILLRGEEPVELNFSHEHHRQPPGFATSVVLQRAGSAGFKSLAKVEGKISRNGVEGSIKLQSPVFGGSEGDNNELNGDFDIQSPNNHGCDFKIQLTGTGLATRSNAVKEYKITLTHEHSVCDNFEHDSELLITSQGQTWLGIGASGQIRLISSHLQEFVMKGDFLLRGPVSLKTQLNADSRTKDELDFHWHGELNNDAIDYKSKVRFGRKPEMEFVLSTPSNGKLKRVEGNMIATFPSSRSIHKPMIITGNLKWHGGETATFETKLGVSQIDGHLEVSVRADSSLSGPFVSALKIHLPLKFPVFMDCSFELGEGNQKKTTVAQIKQINGDIIVKFTHKTPHSLDGLEIEHKSPSRNHHKTKTQLLFGNKKIESLQETKFTGRKSVDVSVQVDTPFIGYQKSLLKAKLALENLREGEMQGEFEFSDWVSKVELNWFHLRNGWRATNRFVLTENGQSLFSYIAKTNGEIDSRVAKGQLLSVQWGDDVRQLEKKVELNFDGKMFSPENMEGHLALEISPHRRLEFFGGAVTIKNTDMFASIKPMADGIEYFIKLTPETKKPYIFQSKLSQRRQRSLSLALEIPDMKKTTIACAVDDKNEDKYGLACSYKGNAVVDVTLLIELIREGRGRLHGFHSTVDVKVPGSSVEEVYFKSILQGFRQHVNVAPKADITIKWGGKEDSNKQKIQFDALMQLEEVFFQLKTPIPGVEHWVVKYKVETKPDIALDASISWGQQQHKITLNGKLDLRKHQVELDLGSSVPTDIIKQVRVSAEHAYDQGTKTHSGVAELSWKYYSSNNKIQLVGRQKQLSETKHEASLKLDSPFRNWQDRELVFNVDYNPKSLKAHLESRVSDEKQWYIDVSHNLTGGRRESYPKSGLIKIYYPYGMHTVSKLKYEMNSDYRTKFSTAFSWMANNRNILDLSLEIGDSGRLLDFYVNNMWRGIQAKYLISNTREGKQAEATFCWDLDEAEDAQIHVKVSNIHVSQRGNDRDTLSITLATPIRTVSIKKGFSQTISSSAVSFDQDFEIIWDLLEERKAGFQFSESRQKVGQKMVENTLKVWIPDHKSQIRTKYGEDAKTVGGAVFVKYLMNRHPDHEMGVEVMLEDKSNRRARKMHHQLTTTITHPMLPHGVTWTTNAIGQVGSLTFCKLQSQLVYSNVENKKLTVEVISGSNKRNGTFFGSFYAFHGASSLDTYVSAQLVPVLRNFFTSLEVRRGSEVSTFKLDTQDLVLQSKTPTYHISLKGQCESTAESSTCKLFSSDKNGENRLEVFRVYSGPNELDVHYFPHTAESDYYRIRGRLHDTVIGAETYRNQDGNRVHDVELKVKLNGPKELKGRIHVRPGLKGPGRWIVNNVPDLGWKVFVAETGNDFLRKLDQVDNNILRDVIDPIGRDFSNGIRELRPLAHAIDRFLDRVFRCNDMLHRVYRSVINTNYRMYFESFCMVIRDSVRLVTEPVWYIVNNGPSAISNRIHRIRRSDMYRAIESKAGNFVEIIPTKLNSMINQASDHYTTSVNDIQEYYDQIKSDFLEHPQVADMAEKIEELQSKVEDVLFEMKVFVDNMIQTVLEQAPWLSDNVIMLTVEDYWNRIKHQVIVLMRYWGMKTSIKECVEDFLEKWTQDALKELASYTLDYKSSNIRFDPDKGMVDIDLWIPLKTESLKKLPDYREEQTKFHNALNNLKASTWQRLSKLRQAVIEQNKTKNNDKLPVEI